MNFDDHPLNKAFNVDSTEAGEEAQVEFGSYRVELKANPEETGLEDIIKYAMHAYKQQMEDLDHIEPKNRLKALEIAERFLNQAKDASDKLEKIKLQKQKFESQTKGKGKKDQILEEDQGVNVEELYKEASRLKAVK